MMGRFLAGLIPTWAYAAAAAALLAGAGVWHAVQVRQAHAAGRAEALAEVAAQSAVREAEDRARAQAAAEQFEALRAAKERSDADAARRLRAALSRPVQCPAAGEPALALGDVRVPADVVDQLRAAGADPAGGAGDPGEPGGAVLGRP